ncbi:MAG: bacteriohemerythrin [Lamprobacter sp.]|uniref:bacteriohemerythrin n=1 Tax=Lamprobacter sp. TaxID=3100796 RepID=UPI002B25EDA1|nr:bacteriohemerythrin [Lamprobacter sp.]MEA3640670.1 bacteriohemerythrin [Lamprobacter sp.]
MQKPRISISDGVAEQTTPTANTYAPLIEWNESYSVNVAEIDRQHRHLIGLYNKLHEAMTRGRGNDILELIFDQLVEYTETHFKEEESYFHAINYADKQAHIIEHHAFVNRLAELQDKFHAGKAFLTVETLTFIRNWLNGHIIGTDKQYSQTFNEHGIF